MRRHLCLTDLRFTLRYTLNGSGCELISTSQNSRLREESEDWNHCGALLRTAPDGRLATKIVSAFLAPACISGSDD